MSNFQTDVNKIKENKGTAVSVSEETFYHFLEAVPPIYFNGGFACGEAYSHNSEGNPVYYCFAQDGETYLGILATIKEAETAFLSSKTA